MVIYNGFICKIVFKYQTPQNIKMYHLLTEGGKEYRNIPEHQITITKSKESKMTKEELNQLTKADLNNLLNNKYSKNQLKNITKDKMVDETLNLIEEQVKSVKKSGKSKPKGERKKGYASRGTLAFAKEIMLTELITRESLAELVTQRFEDKNYKSVLNHLKTNIPSGFISSGYELLCEEVEEVVGDEENNNEVAKKFKAYQIIKQPE